MARFVSHPLGVDLRNVFITFKPASILMMATSEDSQVEFKMEMWVKFLKSNVRGVTLVFIAIRLVNKLRAV